MPQKASTPVEARTDATPRRGTLGARATSGMLWALVERWGSQLLASGVFVVLARLVAPKAFGLVALAGVFVAFANVFLGQGFAQAVIAQRPLRKDHIDTAFWINAGLGAVLAAVGVGCAPLIAHLQGNSDVRPVLQALSLDFFLGALGGIPEALLQRELRFRQLSVRTLVSNVIADVAGIALAVAGAGVWALVVQTLAQTAIDTLILWLVTPQRPGLQVTRAAERDLRSFGLSNTGLNVFSLLNRQSDNFLIGIYRGPTELGYYAVGYQILNLFEDAFVNTTQVVMFPVFASVADDRARLHRAYDMANRATAIIAMPAFVGLSLVSGQMIPLVFGHRWEASVRIAEVLAFIGIVHGLTQFNGQVCKAVGKAGIVLRFSAINTVVNVIGFFIAVHFGIFWVAVAYVARGWALYPFSVTMVRTSIGHDVPAHLRGFVAPIVSTAVMAGAVAGLEAASHDWAEWPRLLACVAVGVAAYTAAISLFAGRQILELVSTVRDARRNGPKRGARRAAIAQAEALAAETAATSAALPEIAASAAEAERDALLASIAATDPDDEDAEESDRELGEVIGRLVAAWAAREPHNEEPAGRRGGAEPEQPWRIGEATRLALPAEERAEPGAASHSKGGTENTERRTAHPDELNIAPSSEG